MKRKSLTSAAWLPAAIAGHSVRGASWTNRRGYDREPRTEDDEAGVGIGILRARGGSHGGAHVTADDLLRFMTAVRSARLTTAATAQMLTSPQGAGRLGDARNGFGFEIMLQNGHTIVGHGGGDIGVSAIVYHFNDSGYTAVVLSNYDPRAIRVIARQVRGLLTRATIGQVSPPPPSDCSTAN